MGQPGTRTSLGVSVRTFRAPRLHSRQPVLAPMRGLGWLRQTLSGLLLVLLLTTWTGCCSSLPAVAPIPLPANQVERPSREKMEGIVMRRDWVDAAKLILAAHDYIDSLERDGHWRRAD